MIPRFCHRSVLTANAPAGSHSASPVQRPGYQLGGRPALKGRLCEPFTDPASNHSASKAFTLIELLVAIAISMLLITLLLSIISPAMRMMRYTSDSLISLNAANAALGLITTDIESLAPGRHVYLQATNSGTNCQLMLIATSPNDSQTSADGQPRGVIYQLREQNPMNTGSANNRIWGLYRAVADSTNTFASLLSTNAATNSAAWGALQAAGIGQSNFIAGNIVDLQVSLQVATNTCPSPFRVSGSGILANNAVVNAPNSSPIVAEVSLTVLEETGAKMLADGLISDLPEAKRKYGKILTSRITLRTPH